MCGIAGVLDRSNSSINNLSNQLVCMNGIQAHRGPDGQSYWMNDEEAIGLAHQRLSIIDIELGAQPMKGINGQVICYNGEIYNYIELRKELGGDYTFKTQSDTEVILAAYNKWGKECVHKLRGMFSFALWDDKNKSLFIARDRFGIKPLYYTLSKDLFYFASEVKTLLPFIDQLKINKDALKDYLYFQLYLGTYTLIENISELPPAHYMILKDGKIETQRYWEVYYTPDFSKTSKYFSEKLHELIHDSIKLHSRSDVPIGAYVSGGIDSSIVASIASTGISDSFMGFTGKFSYSSLYDESHYARELAAKSKIELHEIDITSQDFINSIENVIYHLDYPIAGPGSFPQYHVSKLASKYRKVVLGGQGGDEIFGGYTRYLIAYFEQCIKGAIDNTLKNGNFVVTYESIIPNLVSLQGYKPLLKEFFKDGLFDPIENRYFKLINRTSDLKTTVRWGELGTYDPFNAFLKIFNGSNVKESYFDKMTHFDFKTLLPALLQVEDRMSMAHGIESRVPFLDHPLVEFAATMPADIKFKDGKLKRILVETMQNELPESIINRKDKMGFPVPLNEWLQKDLKEFVNDLLGSDKAKTREFIDNKEALKEMQNESTFGRKAWGLISLEIWFKKFYDDHYKYKQQLIK